MSFLANRDIISLSKILTISTSFCVLLYPQYLEQCLAHWYSSIHSSVPSAFLRAQLKFQLQTLPLNHFAPLKTFSHPPTHTLIYIFSPFCFLHLSPSPSLHVCIFIPIRFYFLHEISSLLISSTHSILPVGLNLSHD